MIYEVLELEVLYLRAGLRPQFRRQETDQPPIATENLRSAETRRLAIGGLVGVHKAGDEGGNIPLQLPLAHGFFLQVPNLPAHYLHRRGRIDGGHVLSAASES